MSAGQSVKKGDNIGKSGNTGSSTGSHLHIECLYNGEYYNPLFYFEAGEQTIYGETTGGTGGGTSNVIPPESYDDATVQTLMREANRYLGMPYTFGGTAPASFDCSGFVCWVFSNSGVHNRQGPQHRAFMTSVLRYQRQMQRQGTSSFLQVLTIHRDLSAMWVSIAETV